MKVYAALPLVLLLLAATAVRETIVPGATPAQRDAFVHRLEHVVRDAGHEMTRAATAHSVSLLPQRSFRMAGCNADIVATAVTVEDMALLRALWSRLSSTLPMQKLTLHYGDGRWSVLDRPAIAWKRIRLQFHARMNGNARSEHTALIVAYPAECEQPEADWPALWRPHSAQQQARLR